MSTLLHGLEDNIDRAAQALMRRQRDDGHWVFELEADATSLGKAYEINRTGSDDTNSRR